jgi:uncharacterized lipoprotein YddW (UPF0748 family)
MGRSLAPRAPVRTEHTRLRVDRFVRWVAVALVAALLVAVLPTAARVAAAPLFVSEGTSVQPAIPQSGSEFRAYWVDAFGDGMYTAAQIDDVVAATKAINANAIVAQVVRRGDCFCNRSAAARTEQEGVTPAPFDPLQTLIDKAHAQGIQVHAWVIATAIWRGSTPPADPSHVFNQHGPSATGSANWVLRRSDGLTQVNTDWLLDPGHPDAAQWVVDVATSIVRNYQVDGINLDRIRYPDNNLGTNVPSWGYNPTAVARFNAETGRSGTPTNTDAQWTQWRRDQITNIVRKIYVESYGIRPSVRISADTIAYGFGPQHGTGFTGTRSYAEVLQDWDGWMREGIIDLNIVMNYKRQLTTNQDVMYQEWSDYAKDHAYGRFAVIGTGLYLNDVASSATQARIAVAPSSTGTLGAGWAGYSYRTPDALTDAGTRSGAASRGALIAAFAQAGVFTQPAAVPNMPWKSAPTTGHLSGSAMPGAQVLLTSVASGAVVRAAKADGKGWYGFVDLAPGTYRVSTAGNALGVAQIVAGQLAGVTPEVGPCVGSVGPGIAAPPSVPSGVPGFHAAWYGQSGYPTLCVGQRSTAVVAYYNSGSRGWVSGRMGEVAYLGTWKPEPGQDAVSPLGGDGTAGSLDTDWPRYNRIALQPADYVGPNQVSWFTFTIQAPSTPGVYRLYLRPLIEGAQWMEDYGVFWVVTVK